MAKYTNAPTIVGLALITLQIAAVIAFPAYREMCIDVAMWGWRQVF